jgi:hypothetical protein
MPSKKPKAIDSVILVVDSRFSEQTVAYCFTDFPTAYSYLEQFQQSARPPGTFVHFYRTLSERRTYLCNRSDGHRLRFQLVRTLYQADMHTLPAEA